MLFDMNYFDLFLNVGFTLVPQSFHMLDHCSSFYCSTGCLRIHSLTTNPETKFLGSHFVVKLWRNISANAVLDNEFRLQYLKVVSFNIP